MFLKVYRRPALGVEKVNLALSEVAFFSISLNHLCFHFSLALLSHYERGKIQL